MIYDSNLNSMICVCAGNMTLAQKYFNSNLKVARETTQRAGECRNGLDGV